MQDSTTSMSQVGGCPPSCPQRSLDVVTWETHLAKLSSLFEWEALGWDREDGNIHCLGLLTPTTVVLRSPVCEHHGGRTNRHRGTDAFWKTANLRTSVLKSYCQRIRRRLQNLSLLKKKMSSLPCGHSLFRLHTFWLL